MITLIRNAQVFNPDALGVRDVLVSGGAIAAIDDRIDLTGQALEVIDADGRWLLPGFVDPLTHPCGGGGEVAIADHRSSQPTVTPFQTFKWTSWN